MLLRKIVVKIGRRLLRPYKGELMFSAFIDGKRFSIQA
jgi:hypothetical protein